MGVKTPLLVYTPILAGFVAWNTLARTPAWEWPVLFVGGLALWTLVEYLLHRWIFHGTALPPKTRQGLHLAHHVEPEAPEKIVAKPWLSLPIAAFIWLALLGATRSGPRASLLMAGVLVGYTLYEFVHFAVHTRPGDGGPLRWWRRNHFYHHFQEPGRVFGVTSPIWDLVFRTSRG